MDQEKTYLEKRFDTMKRQSILKGSSAGMILRIVLLIALLFFGKMFLDWSIDKSHNHVTDIELRAYENSKYKILIKQRAAGDITKKQLQQIADSIHTNAKRDFIIERR